MDFEQREIIRAADSMKLFEHDGVIDFGTWRRWYRARYTPEADAILAEFREQHPTASPSPP